MTAGVGMKTRVTDIHICNVTHDLTPSNTMTKMSFNRALLRAGATGTAGPINLNSGHLSIFRLYTYL